PAADHECMAVGQRPRLRDGCPVENSCADQSLERRNSESAVRDSGGQDDCCGRRLISSVERDYPPVVVAPERSRLSHQRKPGTEYPGLLVCALRELAAAYAPRETQIVADQGAGPGLSADPRAVDDKR